ncbi:Transcription factor [Coemansia aciculifera]|uniref:Transcription factor n=1 Tax=Coemansia aciculifera TaxID=417176 RepID=A0A9W8IM50_9FUNG|nr:Transcription factor [Coemansia aciculifera]KAJ2874473.1 Transcription factor [Coemansia aciculifera]
MSCDDKRPCQRCVKRNIAHMCRDKDPASEGAANGETRKGAKGSSSEGSKKAGRRESEVIPIAPATTISMAARVPKVFAPMSNQAQGVHRSEVAAIVTTGPASAPLSASTEAGGAFPAAAAPVGIVAVQANMQAAGAAAPARIDASSQGYLGEADGAGRTLPLPVQSMPTLPSSGTLAQMATQTGGPSESAAGRSEVSGGRTSYGGMRFDGNAMLMFGNVVASNEFSAINEFLENLQRSTRYADRVDADFNRSNPPSGSPSGPPSSYAIGSPMSEQATAPALQQSSSAVQLQAYAQAMPAGGITAAHGASTSGMGSHDQRTLSLPTISQLMANNSGEGVTQAERFLLTAADPSDGTSEDKLRQIINAKYQAGILKPYNYVSGYTRMQRFMETNVSQPNIIRILEVLNTFRPTFRSIAQALDDLDLLLVEEGFERLLLDYDNVFNSFGVPACLWRRTGEIYKANREFADLVGVPLSYFHEGRVCIYELMPENSTVNYWEKYGEIAFDATQKAVLTSCVLQTAASIRTMVHSDSSRAQTSGSFAPLSTALRPAAHTDQPSPSQPGRPVRCCFSFTLRRDKYKIPLAIVGNFLPIQQQP